MDNGVSVRIKGDDVLTFLMNQALRGLLSCKSQVFRRVILKSAGIASHSGPIRLRHDVYRKAGPLSLTNAYTCEPMGTLASPRIMESFSVGQVLR